MATKVSTGSVTETNVGFKTVEVFSQGRKIIGTNASNIGDLPEGTYLIKVTNATRK